VVAEDIDAEELIVVVGLIEMEAESLIDDDGDGDIIEHQLTQLLIVSR